MIHPTLLLLVGVDQLSLIIVIIVLTIPFFFMWRALLRSLIKKGEKGINIAAFIMGCVQSPFLVLMAGVILYGILASQEARAILESQQELSGEQYEDNLPDATEIDVVGVSPDKCKVLIENEYVRVIEYTIAPGEKDNPHTHPPKSYYVVEGGKLRVYPEKEPPFDVEEKQGTVEWAITLVSITSRISERRRSGLL